jgi:AcrR family transcriptional regulator
MQEIADEAQINKAMLHYYFRSKEKLFQSIFVEAFQQIVPQVRANAFKLQIKFGL